MGGLNLRLHQHGSAWVSMRTTLAAWICAGIRTHNAISITEHTADRMPHAISHAYQTHARPHCLTIPHHAELLLLLYAIRGAHVPCLSSWNDRCDMVPRHDAACVMTYHLGNAAHDVRLDGFGHRLELLRTLKGYPAKASKAQGARRSHVTRSNTDFGARWAFEI